jgi:CRP-like cAMP-binding protein
MNDTRNPQRGLSPLDQAYTLRLSGDTEGALRLAASHLTATPDDVAVAYLVARLLLDGERSDAVGAAVERIVEATIRRGDLPAACVAANLGAEAGGIAPDALARIAAAFCKGSKRLADVSQQPPHLPVAVEIAPFFAKASGAALLDAAEKALKRFVDTKDTLPADGPLPRLPLFGELEADSLQRLLGSLELREVPAGSQVVTQGEEGREAFTLVRGVLNVIRAVDGAPKLLATLGPGAIFGEMALVSDTPRAASVTAVEACSLLVFTRPLLEKLAAKEPAISRELGRFCHGRMVSNLMRHSAILSTVESVKRRDMMNRFVPKTFRPGEALIKQGGAATKLFVIASGGVEVRSMDAWPGRCCGRDLHDPAPTAQRRRGGGAPNGRAGAEPDPLRRGHSGASGHASPALRARHPTRRRDPQRGRSGGPRRG